MSYSEIKKLVPSLYMNVRVRHRNMRHNTGIAERIPRISAKVTKLFQEERCVLSWMYADEIRGYTERLITEAVRHGDTDQQTMDIADFYLKDKAMIHKLFKVIVPRVKDYTNGYTSMYTAPEHLGKTYSSVLEIKGHPYPPLVPGPMNTRLWINNILLDEAKKEYNTMQRQIQETDKIEENTKEEIKQFDNKDE